MAAQSYAAGRAGQGSNGPADGAATQRLLPSGGAVELTSSDVNPYRGGAVRRRARVLQQLESMDLENHGLIDKQKLVDIVDDVIESETSHKSVRWGVLLAVAFAALLLAGVLGLTWIVVGRLHLHVDRLSTHVDTLSKSGSKPGWGAFQPAIVHRPVTVPPGRPFIVLTGVSRSVQQKVPDSADKRARGRSGGLTSSFGGELMMGNGADSGRAKLFPIPYEYVFTGDGISVEQLSQICTAKEQGELDFTVSFKGGVMERGLLTSDTSGSLGRPSREVKPTKNLRKATIHDASLCDDPDQAAGTLVFAVEGADNGGRWSRMASAIEAKITCTPDADHLCLFRGTTPLDTIDCFQCVDKNDATNVWSCPKISRTGSGLGTNTEAEVTRMCGSLAGTCFRNVSRATDQRDYMGWMPGSSVESHIEPTDGCVLFNASNLQCLQCEATCPSACVNADAPPAGVCKEDPEALGCDTCTEGPTCGQQLCGETCIPSHTKVTVRSQAENPKGFNRFRPCCNSTARVPWSLQSDAGAPQGEKRCYPA